MSEQDEKIRRYLRIHEKVRGTAAYQFMDIRRQWFVVIARVLDSFYLNSFARIYRERAGGIRRRQTQMVDDIYESRIRNDSLKRDLE